MNEQMGEQLRAHAASHDECYPHPLVSWAERARVLLIEAADALTSPPAPSGWQQRIHEWMLACFGPVITSDRLERCDRFGEEAIELLQALGYDRNRLDALTDYVYCREAGEPGQEVGGVMVTLAALCTAASIDITEQAETELARVWTKVEQIREKQKAKPTGSALPVATPGQNAKDALPPSSSDVAKAIALANEVKGAFGIAGAQIRAAIGNTNANCMLRRAEAVLTPVSEASPATRSVQGDILDAMERLSKREDMSAAYRRDVPILIGALRLARERATHGDKNEKPWRYCPWCGESTGLHLGDPTMNCGRSGDGNR